MTQINVAIGLLTLARDVRSPSTGAVVIPPRDGGTMRHLVLLALVALVAFPLSAHGRWRGPRRVVVEDSYRPYYRGDERRWDEDRWDEDRWERRAGKTMRLTSSRSSRRRTGMAPGLVEAQQIHSSQIRAKTMLKLIRMGVRLLLDDGLDVGHWTTWRWRFLRLSGGAGVSTWGRPLA